MDAFFVGLAYKYVSNFSKFPILFEKDLKQN